MPWFDVWLEWERGWKSSNDLPTAFRPEMIELVPRPKCLPGQVVTFRWSHPEVLTGEVQRVQANVRSAIRIFPDEDATRVDIYVTANAGGHSRWFNQDNIIRVHKTGDSQ